METIKGCPLLDRKEAAAFLTSHGYKTAPATLAKLACVGGSPIYEQFGRKPLYRPHNLIAWAKSKTKEPRCSTSDNGGNTDGPTRSLPETKILVGEQP